MGLREFFSSVAGTRSIKEIDPSEHCKWLEQPRPMTSSGKFFTKSNISSPALTVDSSTDNKNLMTGDDKSSIFSGRRRKFSLAKGKSDKMWKKRKSMSAVPPAAAEQDVPEVPVLSLPGKERTNLLEAHDIHDEELTRPGTAITTDDTRRTPEPLHFEIFELPAESMAPAQTEPDTGAVAKPRKRSKSSASEHSRRRMSWFAPSRKQPPDELPPIPTPEPQRPRTAGADRPTVSKSTSLPQIATIAGLRDSIGAEALLRSFPSVPSLNSEHNARRASPITIAIPTSPETATSTTSPTTIAIPTSPETATSTTSSNARRASPITTIAIPTSPETATSTTSPTTPRLHDSAVVTSPRKFLGANIDIHKPLPSPTSFSQPISPLVVPDSWPRPPSDGGPSRRRSSDARSTKRRISNATIAAAATGPAPRSARTSGRESESDEGFLSKEQQREYNRVTQFLETMERKRTSGVVRVVTEKMPPVHQQQQRHEREQRVEEDDKRAGETFSNEEALKALEFGIAT